MPKGFPTLELAQQAQSQNKKEKGHLASIDEIQNNLFSYIEEIEDPRVQRTQASPFSLSKVTIQLDFLKSSNGLLILKLWVGMELNMITIKT